MKKLNNKGFTLIELLVVILIISILAAIALPKYARSVEKSRVSEAKTVMGVINHAQTIYHIQHAPDYATDFSALDVDLVGGTVSNDTYTTDTFVYTLESDRITAERRNSDAYVVGIIYEDGSLCCTNGTDASFDICSTLSPDSTC